MKTPKEFDYDLFKDEAGTPHIRVKRTGEVCEVNDATFRLLRNEAMAMYRKHLSTSPSKEGSAAKVVIEQVNTLSLYMCETEEDNNLDWLTAPEDVENEVIDKLIFAEFYRSLTNKQREVFVKCILQGQSARSFAQVNGSHKSTVDETIEAIRKKYKKYFL